MKISVLICTYNRSEKLIKCLQSIEKSLIKAAPISSEIVIVDNNSTDDTRLKVKEWSNNCQYSVIIDKEAKQGIAYARNKSIEVAQGDLFICIDDDCTIDEDYILNVLKYYRHDTDIIIRFCYIGLGDTKDWPIAIQTRTTTKRWKKYDPESDILTMGDITGGNMVLPKSVIHKVGKYDTRFGTKSIPGGEDVDYGFRAYNSGFTLAYAPDIRAYHFHGRDNAVAVINIIKNYSIAAGALYAKHRLSHPRLKKILNKELLASINKIEKDIDPRAIIIRRYYRKYKVYNIVGIINYFFA